MFRLLKSSLVVFLVAAGTQQVSAFSLVGVPPAWQDAQNGYGWDIVGAVHTVGGPMNLGEEYRWNIPNLYYAIDASFLNYFGARGAEEIDKAVKIINDLPPVSQMRIDDFPIKSERVNFRAQALGLVDLKTSALQSLVAEIGLADPQAYVFTLRSRWLDAAGNTNFYVIKRNFDPVTLQNSSYINGDLWTYITIAEVSGGPDFPVNAPVDPLAYGAPVASSESTLTTFNSPVGVFYTGLTRDDVGGLKYIYHPENQNVENPVGGVFPGTGGGPILVSGGTSRGSVWEPLFITSTNGTTAQSPGGNIGSPWDPVLVQPTNNTPPPGTGGGTPTTPPVVGNFINTGLRPGVDKLNLIKVDYDSLLGQFVSSVLDGFTDTIRTNGAPITQGLLRIINAPDILFTAADLFTGGASDVFLRMSRTDNTWTNNGAINRPISDPLAFAAAGPGTLNPGVIITFNNAGPTFWNGIYPFFLSEANPFFIFPIWGTYDGTTNAPVIYPNNISIEDLERQALGR